MKKQFYLLIIEDEVAVLDAILRDVEPFENYFPVEAVQSAEDAEAIIHELEKEGESIALILCDHLLPIKNGVQFLIESMQYQASRNAKKVLVTGQAGHQDTIEAINKAGLDFYVNKPWNTADFQNVIKEQLTSFILQQRDVNPIAYMPVLNGTRIVEHIRKTGLQTDF